MQEGLRNVTLKYSSEFSRRLQTAPLREPAARLIKHLLRHLLEQEHVGRRRNREAGRQNCCHPLARGLRIVAAKTIDVQRDQTQPRGVTLACVSGLAALRSFAVLLLVITRRHCREKPAAGPRRERMQRHVAALCSDRLEKRVHVGFGKVAPPSLR